MGDAWRRRTGFLMRVLAYRAAPPVLIEMLPCGSNPRDLSPSSRKQCEDALRKDATPPAEDRARFGARSLSFCRGCSLS